MPEPKGSSPEKTLVDRTMGMIEKILEALDAIKVVCKLQQEQIDILHKRISKIEDIFIKGGRDSEKQG